MIRYRFSRSEIRVIQLGMAMIVVALVSFALLANTLLLPAMKSISFKETTCTVVSQTMVQSPNLCYPENDCSVARDYVAAGQYNYPCVQVIVTYKEFVEVNNGDVLQAKNERNSYRENRKNEATKKRIMVANVHRAFLHMSDMDILYADQCSYHPPCTRDIEIMKQAVEKFKRVAGIPGSSFRCLYDPRNPTDTVIKRLYTEWSIFHSVVWPIVLLFLGFLIIFIVYCGIARMKGRLDHATEAKQTDGKRGNGGGSMVGHPRTTSTKIGLNGKVHV